MKPIFAHHWILKTLLAVFMVSSAVGAERLRVIVETDAGGDPDDEQSLVRLLLYANEWDVEGIIANRHLARQGENRNRERTGLGIVRQLVRAYGECHANLVQHDPRFPKAEDLLARTVPGHNETRDGVELIIRAVDADDTRPVWFMNWGTDAGSAESCLKRALDEVLRERGQEGYAKFKRKLRLSSDDKFGNHTFELEPPFAVWVDTFRPPVDGKRWYHRFSSITARAGGFDLARDALTNHGPLGALYPTNTTHWQKEGDTMTFLYLVPTGMNDPERPGWGSWAGRYGVRDNADGKPYFWANQPDRWNGSTHRDNSLIRWAAHLQNDFRTRLDWCVKSRDEANHHPIAVLNEDGSGKILYLKAGAGSTVTLDAKGTKDPEGDGLKLKWEIYPEAGTYRGKATPRNETARTATVTIPQDASGKTIHVILTASDDGEPSLVAYRRAIIEVPE